MRIGIIGGGAIGLLFSTLLLEDNHEVFLYVKSADQKNTINRKGIRRLSDSAIFFPKVELTKNLSEHDLFINCTKQYDLQESLIEYSNQKINSPILFIQNGMTHVRLMDQFLNKNTVFIGICEHGAQKKNKHEVAHTGKGSLKVSLYHGSIFSLKSIIQKLHTTIFPITLCDDLFPILHEKLLINAVVNPLTALFHVQNKELLEDQHLLFLAKTINEEVCGVLKMNSSNSWEKVEKVIHNTGENRSSMLMDIINGRKTELEAIIGYIREKAKNENIKTPFLYFLYHAVKTLESRNLSE
ncbi:2-dehydropantoate 2-reductase [Saliterribacillus persicus]|uniref:2-dehydropantoate 2-reductase n=1 Tax=Saliterribacillus persicus TaxID=930114 RepID=A0A368XS72_9BACI|nr:2-dehydropantoate 2-reductase [Saliterribacillus persicus]RCW70812.1 ketopantoate reductase [Saliterribacillus persicus]